MTSTSPARGQPERPKFSDNGEESSSPLPPRVKSQSPGPIVPGPFPKVSPIIIICGSVPVLALHITYQQQRGRHGPYWSSYSLEQSDSESQDFRPCLTVTCPFFRAFHPTMFAVLPSAFLRSLFLRHASTLPLRHLHVLSRYPDIFPPSFWTAIVDKSLPEDLFYSSRRKESSHGHGQTSLTGTFTSISLLLTRTDRKWRSIPPRPVGRRVLRTADGVVLRHYIRMLDSRGGYVKAFRKRYELEEEEGAARINGRWLEVRVNSNPDAVSRAKEETGQRGVSSRDSRELRCSNSKSLGSDWRPWFWILD